MNSAGKTYHLPLFTSRTKQIKGYSSSWTNSSHLTSQWDSKSNSNSSSNSFSLEQHAPKDLSNKKSSRSLTSLANTNQAERARRGTQRRKMNTMMRKKTTMREKKMMRFLMRNCRTRLRRSRRTSRTHPVLSRIGKTPSISWRMSLRDKERD